MSPGSETSLRTNRHAPDDAGPGGAGGNSCGHISRIKGDLLIADCILVAAPAVVAAAACLAVEVEGDDLAWGLLKDSGILLRWLGFRLRWACLVLLGSSRACSGSCCCCFREECSLRIPGLAPSCQKRQPRCQWTELQLFACRGICTAS